MNYYDEKNEQTWKVIGVAIKSLLLLVIVLWLMHACVAAIDKHQDPAGELSRQNRAEIMRWTDYEKAQHLDMADKYLTARVERNWGEVK